MSNLVKSLNKFSYETLQRTNSNNDAENTVFSPYSAFVCVAMSNSLFNAETRKEILKSLQIDNQEIDVETLLKQLKELIQKENTDKVSSSNKIWANQAFNFSPETFSPNESILGIPIEKVGFPQPGCEKINSEVERATKGMITNLISPSDLSSETAIVLLNAIYFKSDWMRKFKIMPDSNRPEVKNFTLVDGSKVHVTMLELKETRISYAETDEFQAVSVPYLNNEYEFIVILPKNNTSEGYEALKNLPYEKFNQLLKNLSYRKVNIRLPKFSFESKIQLNDVFLALGMQKAFGSEAQCVDPAVKYFVSSIIQKAKIVLDENGTEAAAATAMVMNCLSCRIEPPTPCVYADHPFVYLLRNTGTEAILFEGFVKNPSE